MEEEEELQLERLWEKRQQEVGGIIAIMGPPCSRKTSLARLIGYWGKCPALCIQHFFFQAAAAKDYDMKKKNEEEVVQQAFTNLCKVADFQFEMGLWTPFKPTVVIKSRLNSTFELQHLLEFVARINYYPLLIIECRFTNEYLWEQRFNEAREYGSNVDYSWYRLGSWEEMEKARDDYYQSVADWNLLLQQLTLKASTNRSRPIVVRRLVVDPVDDIFSHGFYNLPIDVVDAIKYLLTTPQPELFIDHISQENPYSNTYYTVGLHELRPHLFEKRLRARLAAKGRTTHMYCPGGECVFKYNSEHLVLHDDIVCCGVCGKQVVDSGTPAYACRLCILTLHKPCAEKLDFKALRFTLGFLLKWKYRYHELMPEKHACKSCLDGGEGFCNDCDSCNFQTHLKCGILPTTIHHNSHPPHFLSLLVTRQSFRCKACGEGAVYSSYCCKPCGLYYHLKCAFLPLELLKHEHGGHEHVMKLLYSHHDTDEDSEPEESYWCDVCGEDMDPQAWCYSCQDCPYYVTHLKCARGYVYLQSNVKNAKFVQQIQSQLEDALDDPELHEEEFDSELHEEESDSELHEEESDSETSDNNQGRTFSF